MHVYHKKFDGEFISLLHSPSMLSMRYRRLHLIILVLLALLGCSKSNSPNSLDGIANAAKSAGPNQLHHVTINYPTRSGAVWPMFIAKEGGYFENNSLDVKLVFGVHPGGIAMLASGEGQATNYALDQALQASTKDGSLVAVGSSLNTAPLLALLAKKNGILKISDLKGKRVAVSQIGDASYNYTIALLKESGLAVRDVVWIPIGSDANGRAAALAGGRVDATLLSAPASFRMEEGGYRKLATLSDFPDIFVSSVYLLSKSAIKANPALPEQLIVAYAQAIKRFYEDRDFAIQVYLKYDNQNPADVGRIYDRYAQTNAFERIPYVLDGAVKAAIILQEDPSIKKALESYDLRTVIDNSTVDHLVMTGFFEALFGSAIKTEAENKKSLAFRR